MEEGEGGVCGGVDEVLVYLLSCLSKVRTSYAYI